MKKLIFSVVVLILVSSCNTSKKEKVAINSTKQTKIVSGKGYELMQNNCFACHMEKPDPSKKGQMLAPPMLKVQQHYKPSYPNKDEFVKAVVAWVKNPSEDKVMMPGAVRKFNLMPKLTVPEEDIKQIAKTLYEIDFGNMPKMQQKGSSKLELNNGKKWQLNNISKQVIKTITNQLTKFDSQELSAYNQLGKDVFSNAKTILLDKSYDENTFSQIQKFFHNIEGNMHNLIAAKTIEDAKNEQQILIKKFNQFNNFFE